MTKKDSTMNRYVLSSVITFFAAFFAAILTQIDNLTVESFTTGAVVSLLFTAVRSGLKGFMEYYLKITADVI